MASHDIMYWMMSARAFEILCEILIKVKTKHGSSNGQGFYHQVHKLLEYLKIESFNPVTAKNSLLLLRPLLPTCTSHRVIEEDQAEDFAKEEEEEEYDTHSNAEQPAMDSDE